MPALMERPDKREATEALGFIEGLLSGFPFVGRPTARWRSPASSPPWCAASCQPHRCTRSARTRPAPAKASSWTSPPSSPPAGAARDRSGKDRGGDRKAARRPPSRRRPVVSIDNVNGELGGDMLCQLTERPLVRVRILGKSEAPELECRSTTFATGNNLILTGT